MSSSVIVNISGPKNQKLRRSRCQCTHPPKSPSTRKSAASTALQRLVLPVRVAQPLPLEVEPPHPDLRRERRLPLGQTAACRTAPRLKLYMNASYVSLLNVQSQPISVRHAVGSPSLIGGKYAARIGWVANGVMPNDERADARQEQLPAQQRLPGGGSAPRAATPGAASMPAMWLA